MATRPVFATVDKSSTVPGVAGTALAAELACQAFPESYHKRNRFFLMPVGNAKTVGNTPVELFIDGIQNFRFRIADRSCAVLKILGAYNNDVAGSNTMFEMTIPVQNIGGTLGIISGVVNTKFPAASTCTLVVAVDNPSQALTFTFTGNAGDTNGRVELQIIGVSEVTDLG